MNKNGGGGGGTQRTERKSLRRGEGEPAGSWPRQNHVGHLSCPTPPHLCRPGVRTPRLTLPPALYSALCPSCPLLPITVLLITTYTPTLVHRNCNRPHLPCPLPSALCPPLLLLPCFLSLPLPVRLITTCPSTPVN